jgi:hypothetical protein
VYLGHNMEECYTKNWEDGLLKLENILNSWKQRKLSIFGKVTIIKTLALPKLTYRFSLLYVPENIIKRVKKVCFGFLWYNRERVKRSVMYNKLNEGGVNMVDIDSHIHALRAAWVTRFINNPSYFNVISDILTENTGLSLLQFLKSNLRSNKFCDILTKMPVFYQEVFFAYNLCKSIKSFDNE